MSDWSDWSDRSDSLFRSRSLRALVAPAALVGTLAAGPAFGAGTLVTIDGLKSTTPASWKDTTSGRPMRFKEFTIPKADGDAHDAELVIYFFGPGEGGGVDANLARWKSTFEPPAGKKIDDVAKVEPLKIHGLKATMLDVRGTYQFKASPMAPGPAEPRPNYRMLAVVFESPKGPYFMRLVGPERTIERNRKDFDKWLKGFK